MQKKFLALVLMLLVTFIPSVNAQDSVQTGHIRLVPDTGTSAPAGVAIFGLQIGGVLISEAGVPSTTTIQSGRIFADVVGPVNTGIAIANPSAQEAAISFYFTDSSGRDFGDGSFNLPAKRQIAAFLSERPFGLTSSMTGTFTFTSSVPVAAIALRSVVNERNEVLMTTLPVSPVGSSFGGSAVVIPHFADGAGWSTEIVLVNPGETPLSGSVEFFGQGSKTGKALPLRVVINGVTNYTFNYTVASRSAVRMRTQPARTSAEVGSVRITPATTSSAPSSLAIFSYENDGTTVSAASVSAMPAAKALRMYIESAGSFGTVGSVQTGLAISNPSEGRVAVQLDVLKLDGTHTGLSTSVDIPPGGHVAKFANELFPELPSPFRGVIRISAPSPVAVSGLRGRYNERGDLLVTTTPPHDEDSVRRTEINFPHFVTGAGYSTQLILLSTGVAHSGTLSLISKDGASLTGSGSESTP